MAVRKAVIPAAGLGTRFLPLTRYYPKELLPLVDRPVIHYVVEEARGAGLSRIIMVISPEKRSLLACFSPLPELEARLRDKGKHELAEKVCFQYEDIEICCVYQEEPLGLGHAVLAAEEAVAGEPFAVLLPDELFSGNVLAKLLSLQEKLGGSVIAVERVSGEEISRYGAISPEKLNERIYRVRDLVEKPEFRTAPSDLAVMGRYVLTPEVFDALRRTRPGAGGEIQLTDGLKLLLERQPIYAYEYEGRRWDLGVPLAWLKTMTLFALSHPELGPAYREFLRGLKLE